MQGFDSGLTRRAALLGSAAAALEVCWRPALAAEVMRALVGFPPGGAIDTTARVYADAMKDSKYGNELPMSEAEFRATLDPVAIVKNRATIGGPQPAEMERMVKAAREQLAAQGKWIKDRRDHINQSLASLDKAFDALAASAGK